MVIYAGARYLVDSGLPFRISQAIELLANDTSGLLASDGNEVTLPWDTIPRHYRASQPSDPGDQGWTVACSADFFGFLGQRADYVFIRGGFYVPTRAKGECLNIFDASSFLYDYQDDEGVHWELCTSRTYQSSGLGDLPEATAPRRLAFPWLWTPRLLWIRSLQSLNGPFYRVPCNADNTLFQAGAQGEFSDGVNSWFLYKVTGEQRRDALLE